MSTRAKTFATVAAIAALVVVFCGTVQAQPQAYSVTNYNFQQWDELNNNGTAYSWNGNFWHQTSLPDGMMAPFNTAGPVDSGFDQGYPSNWWNATDPNAVCMIPWNPTTTTGAAQTYATGYLYDAAHSLPAGTTAIGNNPTTTIYGPVTPATINPGDPTRTNPASLSIAGWSFNYSKLGSGTLPGSAAGSQCLVNAAPLSWGSPDPDEADSYMVPGSDPDTYQGGVNTPTSVSSYGGGFDTLQAHKRYTCTIAVASPLGATADAGMSMVAYDITTSAHGANEVLGPMGSTINNNNASGGFTANGVFRDVSMTYSTDELVAIQGGDVTVGSDQVGAGFGICPGVAVSNYRFISQNFNPLYFSGAGSWNGSNWSTTSYDDTTAASYSSAWGPVNSHTADAVFEKNGATSAGTYSVNVSSPVTANSLSFATDMTTGSYTLTTSNNSTITLTGDATVTVGSGTNQGWGTADQGGGTNLGGGTATIDCVLAGSNGMYKAGAGWLYLTRSNTYSGVTTVGGGILFVGNGGTSGSIPGNVSNLAELDFNRSDTYTYTGTISGTGCVNITGGTGGTGTTVFTGNHTYTGLTSIAGGTLQIGNGSTSGSIAGDIVIGDLATAGATSHGTLAFNRSDTVTYGGYIYGTGNLVQKGTGTLIISDNTTNATGYSGTMVVQAGKLQINQASPTMNVLTNGTSAGVDIKGGGLVLDYSNGGSNPATMVQSLLASSYSGGFMSGQLRDTAATSSIGLGWADSPTINNHAYTNQVVVVSALYGDATLDGTVDGYDLGALLGSYTHSGKTWAQGDFTYDGTVDGYDLGKLLGNYTKTGPVVMNVAGLNLDAAELGALRAAGITPMTDVPEPSSIILLLAAAVWGGFGAIRRWRKRTA